MDIALKIAICLTLVLILFQDLKSRGIYWFLPMVLFAFFSYFNYLEFEEVILDIIVYNTSILLLFGSLLMLYFLLRYGKNGLQTLKSQVGLGDALFILALTPAFLPQQFILFLTISFALSLLIGLTMMTLKRWNTIPLAGLQSGFLLLLFISNSTSFFSW